MGSLTLREAIERSLCSSPSATAARSQIDMAVAQVGTAKASFFPEVTIGGGLGPVYESTTYQSFSQSDSTVHAYSTDARANLIWVLYDYGLRSSKLARARNALHSASESRNATIQSVALQTAQTYCDVQRDQALLQVAQVLEKSANSSAHAASVRYTAGVGNVFDQLAAQTSLNEATLGRQQAEMQLKKSLGLLALAIGSPPDIALRINSLPERLPDSSALDETVSALADQALNNNPAIASAMADLSAAQADVDIAKSVNGPTVSLLGTIERSDTPIQQASSKEIIKSAAVGLQISIPIFDWFARQERLREAQAVVHVKAARLEDLKRSVMKDIWVSLTNAKADVTNYGVAVSLSENAQKSLDAAMGRYEGGVGSLIEVFTAERTLGSARTQLASIVHDYLIACLSLGVALGQLQDSPTEMPNQAIRN